MTVENYFLLIQEHKMLKNEVEKQNKIIEEQKANNEEMRELIKMIAKKIN